MRKLCMGILSGFLFCFLVSGWAYNQSISWFKIDAEKQVSLRVDLFLSSTCPYCEKASQFFKSLETQNTWLDVHRHIINQDKTALETYHWYLQQQNLDDFMVPAIFFCNTRWAGFRDTEKTGKKLLKNLNYCRQEISKTGGLSKTTQQILQQTSNASWYEESMVSRPGAMVLIPSMAVIDALNPGAAFIIVTLFSLILLQKQRKLQIGTFILFLIGTGFAHFMQQAFTITFYQMTTIFRFLAIVSGVGLLSYLFLYRSEKFSSRHSLMASISLMSAFLTGLMVQIYQQMHAANFSLIFQQWVVAQGLNPFTQYLYELAYQLVYLLAIGLLSLLMTVIFKNYGKRFFNPEIVSEFGWGYLIIIGLALTVYPYLLANVWFAFLVFILALVFSWVHYKISSRHT